MPDFDEKVKIKPVKAFKVTHTKYGDVEFDKEGNVIIAPREYFGFGLHDKAGCDNGNKEDIE